MAESETPPAAFTNMPFFRCDILSSNQSMHITYSESSCHMTVTLTSTAIVTLLLMAGLTLVVAESSLPKAIKRLSYTLVHDRNKRNAAIFITYCFMCFATALAVVSLL